MRIKLYRPQNPILRKYIECFYTLRRSSEDAPTIYLTFPSVFTIITISENTTTNVEENSLVIAHCADRIIETNLVCDFNQPVFVKYEGRINECVVYFKPLGINAFLDKNLSHYNKESFPDFEPFEDYKTVMTNILSIEKDEDKLQKLEDYWLSNLKGFEHPFLSEIIDELMNENSSSKSFSELALKYKISRMTLNKLFNLHICKTPTQFRKIVRFRNAMKRYLVKSSAEDLTNIAHGLNYFDQSHMIKDFKSLTGYSPKTFFSRISKIENGQINWLFL
jgi:AraC-like DNA-binding protein